MDDVMFRVDTSRDWKGTVFALFPHDVCDRMGNVTHYQHVGQHSGADYLHCIANSRPATEEEARSLRAELESIGYELNVVKRRNYTKFRNSYLKHDILINKKREE